MIDILLKVLGVEATMLLWTTFAVWCEKVGYYLKFNNKEKKENV